MALERCQKPTGLAGYTANGYLQMAKCRYILKDAVGCRNKSRYDGRYGQVLLEGFRG